METETLQQKKIKLTPKLRFEEFEEPWNKQKLGTIASLISGFAFKGEHFTEEGQKVLIPKNFTQNGYGNFSENFLKYTTEKPEEKYECRRNDLLVLLTDLTSTCELLGKPLWLLEDDVFYLNQRIVKLLIDSDDLSKNFIFYSLQTENYHKKIVETATGSTVRHSSNKILLNYLLSLPNFPEQQKIATFLSAVDKKLQQLTRKKALLETYKKGVMQKLFSQEMRFKDYNSSKNGILERDFPEWERKKYGEIYSFLSTNSFSRDQLNYEKGDVKNIHYGDIHTKLPTLFNLKDENIPFVNPEIDISRIKTENYCQEGDLVIADASEDYKDIGKAIELIALNGEKVVGGLHTFIARPAKGKISKGFSGYLMQSWKLRKQIMTIAQGTKVLGLSVTRLKNLKLEIPSLEEQQKIANFLSAIDKKTEAVSQQIDKMQSFKKGLLQQMFV